LKKFKFVEANNTVELAIHVESLIQRLDKKFNKGEIRVEDYLDYRKQVNILIEKNKELIEQWKEKIDE
jgi:hypothetical protein